MVSAALTFGVIIFAGLALILVKLPRRLSLWLLGHGTWVDVFVTCTTLIIHWGTMTGLMSATVAGLCCALATSLGKYLFGYIKGDRYYPGIYNAL